MPPRLPAGKETASVCGEDAGSSVAQRKVLLRGDPKNWGYTGTCGCWESFAEQWSGSGPRRPIPHWAS